MNGNSTIKFKKDLNMETLDLATLSRRTHLSVELLKHVIERQMIGDPGNLIPGRSMINTGDRFDPITATLIVSAAALYSAGCSEGATKMLLKWACLLPKAGRKGGLNLPAIARGLTEPIPAVLQLGDGDHVRTKVGSVTTAWYSISGGRAKPSASFEPSTIIALDLARIRDAVRAR